MYFGELKRYASELIHAERSATNSSDFDSIRVQVDGIRRVLSVEE